MCPLKFLPFRLMALTFLRFLAWAKRPFGGNVFRLIFSLLLNPPVFLFLLANLDS